MRRLSRILRRPVLTQWRGSRQGSGGARPKRGRRTTAGSGRRRIRVRLKAERGHRGARRRFLALDLEKQRHREDHKKRPYKHDLIPETVHDRLPQAGPSIFASAASASNWTPTSIIRPLLPSRRDGGHTSKSPGATKRQGLRRRSRYSSAARPGRKLSAAAIGGAGSSLSGRSQPVCAADSL